MDLNFGTWLVYDPVNGRRGDGVFYVNSKTRFGGVTDGSSQTLCIAEVKAYTSYIRNTQDPGVDAPTSSDAFSGFTGQLKLGALACKRIRGIRSGATAECITLDSRRHSRQTRRCFISMTALPTTLISIQCKRESGVIRLVMLLLPLGVTIRVGWSMLG